MGRPAAGCPGREPDYPKPAGTRMGVSACIYDSNSLGDRAKVVADRTQARRPGNRGRN